MLDWSDSPGDQDFERLLRDGINAAKSGQRRLAQSLLRQASILNGGDARPYLWLSAATDDHQEQRQYLEQAVVVDPNNSAARRGLALLNGKIDPSRLVPEGMTIEPRHPTGPEDAQAQSFLCPKCGGRMSFSVQKGGLACEYCGSVTNAAPHRSGDFTADKAEQVLDFVMPTTLGHRWAEAQHRLACERCGALILLPPGQKTNQCAYCGSNQLVSSSESLELLDPQVIALMRVDATVAARRVKSWLGRGIFTPDDLLSSVRHLQLRPAYYSFWTFDGTLEARWSCQVKEGSDRYARWVSRNGTETRFFDDVLVPGVKALTQSEQESIEPFDLKEVQDFKPEFLAGWPALIYDRSLADASLLAREKMTKKLRRELVERIEIGKEKRDIQISAGNWSGMTFKHLLLPLWIGTYHYQDKEYHLLVNGQTGKVGGTKPRDQFKVIMATLIAGLVLLLFASALYGLWSAYGG